MQLFPPLFFATFSNYFLYINHWNTHCRKHTIDCPICSSSPFHLSLIVATPATSASQRLSSGGVAWAVALPQNAALYREAAGRSPTDAAGGSPECRLEFFYIYFLNISESEFNFFPIGILWILHCLFFALYNLPFSSAFFILCNCLDCFFIFLVSVQIANPIAPLPTVFNCQLAKYSPP